MTARFWTAMVNVIDVAIFLSFTSQSLFVTHSPILAGPGRRNNPFMKKWRRAWGSDKNHPLTRARQRFEALLRRFARNFCAPHMLDEPCLYQREPTLRVVVPSPFATGRPHTDSEYKHQPAEVNWWLPLCDVFGNNTLFVESSPGRADFHGLNLRYGQVRSLEGVLCPY